MKFHPWAPGRRGQLSSSSGWGTGQGVSEQGRAAHQGLAQLRSPPACSQHLGSSVVERAELAEGWHAAGDAGTCSEGEAVPLSVSWLCRKCCHCPPRVLCLEGVWKPPYPNKSVHPCRVILHSSCHCLNFHRNWWRLGIPIPDLPLQLGDAVIYCWLPHYHCEL